MAKKRRTIGKGTGATFDEEPFGQLIAEARWAVTLALRNLYRLHGGDAEAVGQEMAGIDTAAGGKAAEPIVIRVETLGAVALVTLREYVEEYVQDREIGLEDAREILVAAPRPFVYNADDAISRPEYLQLHSALDEDLLRAEIRRLEKEDH
ncbi:MAG TPA: hypothetical protein VHA80_03290 [Solirubrobacterales bacterium]|nr:hypothetical protein [Solirubrobacterales bacterium]